MKLHFYYGQWPRDSNNIVVPLSVGHRRGTCYFPSWLGLINLKLSVLLWRMNVNFCRLFYRLWMCEWAINYSQVFIFLSTLVGQLWSIIWAFFSTNRATFVFKLLSRLLRSLFFTTNLMGRFGRGAYYLSLESVSTSLSFIMVCCSAL